eukprot:CAMPEP_0182534462 /NCGR_PEP_ID=MMETSP1323-20130603/15824_1 /TAXON_ID=236787 /ORGANISM="Florenciella parvula, Strain RCC1693" /LENGTH=89 /DNA_ID=CAMNT_0024744481 /DNA_START=91 /DNA_END=357 /DNA_ORIENTATION=-
MNHRNHPALAQTPRSVSKLHFGGFGGVSSRPRWPRRSQHSQLSQLSQLSQFRTQGHAQLWRSTQLFSAPALALGPPSSARLGSARLGSA